MLHPRQGTRRLGAVLLTLLAATSGIPAGADDDILRPEEAFAYTVESAGDRVTVRWDIEPGHYLYRERMAYSSTTPGVTLGPAEMPDGKPYDDEFFGRMEIYRGRVEVILPIAERAAGVERFDLEIRSQDALFDASALGRGLADSPRPSASRPDARRCRRARGVRSGPARAAPSVAPPCRP